MLLIILGWVLFGVIFVYAIGLLDRNLATPASSGFLMLVFFLGPLNVLCFPTAIIWAWVENYIVNLNILEKVYKLGRGK